MREQVDDEENDDEDMGVAETYSDYMPPKCKLLFGVTNNYKTYQHLQTCVWFINNA